MISDPHIRLSFVYWEENDWWIHRAQSFGAGDVVPLLLSRSVLYCKPKLSTHAFIL